MNCHDVQSALTAFHFGEISIESRSLVESHLVECHACVRDFLALKRAVETAEQSRSPSELARARLRRAVSNEVARQVRRTSFSWWERPLAVSCAGAVLLVAMKAVTIFASAPASSPHGATGHSALVVPAHAP